MGCGWEQKTIKWGVMLCRMCIPHALQTVPRIEGTTNRGICMILNGPDIGDSHVAKAISAIVPRGKLCSIGGNSQTQKPHTTLTPNEQPLTASQYTR